MDLTVAAVRRRLKTKVSDMPWSPHVTLKPAIPLDVENDEKRLGLALPPLMKRLYTEIGNGGFGPGYGLIGLTNGVPDDLGKTAPTIYEQFRGGYPSEPEWAWPDRLLPICNWGCAILSCVDCADADFRMRIFDPNAHGEGDWSDAFFEESESFDSWIGAWASGIDLWDLMYGKQGRIARILAERRRDR